MSAFAIRQSRSRVAIITAIVLAATGAALLAAGPPSHAYTTPGSGVVWTLDDLVANSTGAVAVLGPALYALTQDLVVAASDTVLLGAGQTLRVDATFGIRVDGTLRAPGGGWAAIESNATTPSPGDWAGIDVTGTLDLDTVRLEHAQQAIRAGAATAVVSFIYGWIGNSFPGTVVIGAAQSVTIANSTLWGGSPPIGPGADTVALGPGTVTGNVTLSGNLIYGGNGTTDVGGDAIFANTLDGRLLIRDNWVLQGGPGAASAVPGGSGSLGGAGIRITPVANVAGLSVEVSRNAEIHGGSGGDFSSTDGVAGNGGPGIQITDTDSTGYVLLEGNPWVSGGNGGMFSGTTSTASTVSGNGGNGIFLSGLVNPSVRTTTAYGGNGGINFGGISTDVTASRTGAGGTGMRASAPGLQGNDVRVSGGSGGNSFGGGNVTGGTGGIGLWITGSGAVVLDNSIIAGGFGGGDVAPLPGSLSNGGDGGAGVFLTGSSITLNGPTVTGGPGGTQTGAGTQVPGNGGLGISGAASGSISVYGGIVTGGRGGHDQNATTAQAAGLGARAVSLSGLATMTFDGAFLQGGAGGDGSGPGPAGDGGGGVYVASASNQVTFLNSPGIAVGAGGQALGGGTPGNPGLNALEIGAGVANVLVQGNALTSASSRLIEASSSLTARDNTFSGGPTGIFLNSNSNSLLVNNTFATTFAALVCSGGSNYTATDVTVSSGAYLVHASFCAGMTISEAAGAAGVGLLAQLDTLLQVINTTLGTGGGVTANLASNVTFLNTTFDASGVSVAGGSRLLIQNYLAVRTQNPAGSGLSGSDVEVLDNGSPRYATPLFGGFDAPTGISGEVRWIVVTDRVYNNSNTATENATDLQVSAAPFTFTNNPRSVDMSMSHTEVFTPPDDVPPLTLNVLLDGLASRKVGDNILVLLTATIDDTLTNGSAIASANYTMGPGNWASAQPMTATDGGFDTPSEAVEATLDSAVFPDGVTSVCVYGTDAAGNGDPSGACATLEVDRAAPLVTSFLVNGMPLPADTPQVINITATFDDTTAGATNIVAANLYINGGPAGPMLPLDGAFDGLAEDAYASSFLSPEGSANVYCVEGIDAVGNNGSACGTVRFLDPPAISAVLVNGSASWTAVAGSPVNLTATLSDLGHGDSFIASANATVDPGNWASSTPMLAQDGAFDGWTEYPYLVLDTSFIPLGVHPLCVYGMDIAGAANLTGACATLTVVATDTTPPTLLDLRLENTQVSLTRTRGQALGIYGLASDMGRGDSDIVSANVTVDGDWVTAVPLLPGDGAFDEPMEDLMGTLSTWGLPLGNRQVCLHAMDAAGNQNLTGLCMSLILTDTIAPRTDFVTLDGSSSLIVVQGALVTVRGIADDGDSPTRGASLIASGNFTLDANWASAVGMTPEDGVLDDFTEWLVGSLDTTGLAPGSHTVCLNAADIVGNENLSQMACSSLAVTITADTTPPEISGLLLTPDGGSPVPGPISLLRGLRFGIEATVSDAATGGSTIASARLSWDGLQLNMTPANGAFDEVTEVVRYFQAWTWNMTLGPHTLCVQATDNLGNANPSGACTTVTLRDDVEPYIYQVRLNGSGVLTVPVGTVVNVTGIVDDSTGGIGRGQSNISAANFTLDGDWSTAVSMAALDGTFDNPIEEVYGFLDTTGMAIGTFLVCVFGEDELGNKNVTASAECQALSIIPVDNLPPELTQLALNGVAADASVVSGTSVAVRVFVTEARTGGATIAGVNVTVDGDWAGALDLTAEDGAFDEIFEWAVGSLGTSGLGIGVHALCAHGEDARGNQNLTGFCRNLTVTAPPGGLAVNHTAVTRGTVGVAISLAFTVSGEVGAVTATVHFQAPGASTFSQTTATCTGGTCTAEIPAPGAVGTLRYYLEVTDGTRTVRDPATGDHAVAISAAPPEMPEGIPAWVFGVIALLAVLAVLLLVLLLRRRRPAEAETAEEPIPEAPEEGKPADGEEAALPDDAAAAEKEQSADTDPDGPS